MPVQELKTGVGGQSATVRVLSLREREIQKNGSCIFYPVVDFEIDVQGQERIFKSLAFCDLMEPKRGMSLEHPLMKNQNVLLTVFNRAFSDAAEPVFEKAVTARHVRGL